MKQVPVEVARDVARRCDKAMVVIVAYDEVHNRRTVTTYGRSPEQKVAAAEFGDLLMTLDGADPSATRHEDFRTLDAARNAANVEVLSTACRSALHAMLSLRAVREGMSDDAIDGVVVAMNDALNRDGVPR